MSPFQVFVVSSGSLLTIAVFYALLRRWLRWKEGAVAMIVLLGVTLAGVWPDVTTQIARSVGIRRGADLILYCTTLTMLVGFVMMYARLRRLRADITVLVRELAILGAESGADDHPPRGSDPGEKP